MFRQCPYNSSFVNFYFSECLVGKTISVIKVCKTKSIISRNARTCGKPHYTIFILASIVDIPRWQTIFNSVCFNKILLWKTVFEKQQKNKKNKKFINAFFHSGSNWNTLKTDRKRNKILFEIVSQKKFCRMRIIKLSKSVYQEHTSLNALFPLKKCLKILLILWWTPTPLSGFINLETVAIHQWMYKYNNFPVCNMLVFCFWRWNPATLIQKSSVSWQIPIFDPLKQPRYDSLFSQE